ncbi:translation initiation factor IF-2 [bacterium]|nr:translation initiation factor IF-2 [bacterium]
MKVHKLAKKVGLPSKEVIKELKKLGVSVKTHMSDIEDDACNLFVEMLREEGKLKEQKTVKKEKSSLDYSSDGLSIPSGITVGQLATMINVNATALIKKLIERGIFANVNQMLNPELAVEVAIELGYDPNLIRVDDEKDIIVRAKTKTKGSLSRAPIVTVMGHVDHGKTCLLDAIRHADVAGSEKGSITQHIGAYKVNVNKRDVVFIDTPGHEAFTSMRARGAHVTDIVVLVVAADDGIMPQTIEAINHAKAANVPVVVAINKIDKPDADVERVKQQLSEQDLTPEEWGGKTVCVEVSAIKKQGLDNLLEMLLLEADMLELTVDTSSPAKGTVIESRIDKGKGHVATVIIQEGTLRMGDAFISGICCGKVRALINDEGKRVYEAGPSTPVEILGFSEAPEIGEGFLAVESEKVAKEISLRLEAGKHGKRGNTTDFSGLVLDIKDSGIKVVSLIVKGDVRGSIEPLCNSLEVLSLKKVKVNVIHSGIGNINESDVLLASSSGAIILGFGVHAESGALDIAEKNDVSIRYYSIIYEAIDNIKKLVEGLIEPEYKKVLIGKAEVRQIFKISKTTLICGSYVLEGKIRRDCVATLTREGKPVYQGKISSLRRFKNDAKEVKAELECGIGLDNCKDVQEGDIIEAHVMEKEKLK